MCPFQSTRPRGARQGHGLGDQTNFEFQSTRPRGARQSTIENLDAPAFVSIHAPAGGATSSAPCTSRRRARFNPRARGGRDYRRNAGRWHPGCFNPRARGGRDSWLRTSCDLGVSCFNPRARGGRDVFCHVRPLTSFLFQSTRPRGARPGQPGRPRAGRRFNPRARGGRDPRWPNNVSGAASFNPRARGGRDLPCGHLALILAQVSIHAPAGGATGRAMIGVEINAVSIHAPAGGATVAS